MDKTVGLDGLMTALAQLRSNAVLAVKTSGGTAASRTDVERLDAIAARVFEVPLRMIESAPLGSAPKPDGPTMAVLLDRLPPDVASEALAFLVDLHHRVHDWLTG
jgi:hypothetical protein